MQMWAWKRSEEGFDSGKVIDFFQGTLGARLFQQPSSASSIGWLIKAGPDFPRGSRDQLESWGSSLVFEERKDRQNTRGRLVYKESSHTGRITLFP